MLQWARMKNVIVTPTYNEKDNIARLLSHLVRLPIDNVSIVVVDDNSPDGTSSIVRDVMKEHASVHLISRAGKLGLGTAYIEGFQKALSLGADCVIQMDADFSHDPDDISRLVSHMDRFDVAIGSRKIMGGKIVGLGSIRKGMSAGAMFFSRLCLRFKTKDVTAGFRCFKRHVLEAIDLPSIKSNGYAFQEEVLFRIEQKGFFVKEVPVTFVDRKEGKSKLSKKDIVEFFLIILKLRKQRKKGSY